MADPNLAIQIAMNKLLRPLARLLLRNGMAYSEFAELTRQAYVEVANKDFAVPGRKQSQTRISLLTGIHRHEVAKLLKKDSSKSDHRERHHRAARIISAWQTDPKFSDNGVARDLSIDNEFASLVAEHGADVTSRSVLDELERVGAIAKNDSGTVKLLVTAFTPLHSNEDLIYIFGDAVADLLGTFEYNLVAPDSEKRLQMTVVYDNLPDEVLQNVELVCRDRAMDFLKELSQFLATQDRSSNPALKGTERNRAGIGLYYFQGSAENEDSN